MFDAALKAVEDWHAALPKARSFCPWPTDLCWQPRRAHQVPCINQMRNDPGKPSARSKPALHALQAVAPHLEWRFTYTPEEVGQHFLDHYGWVELAGPTGHFLSYQTRITIGYWGRNLWYDWHNHRAEELYTIVSGEANFHAEGATDRVLRAGATRYHASDQPHAMTTQNHPVLALVFWRGEGLSDSPRLSA